MDFGHISFLIALFLTKFVIRKNDSQLSFYKTKFSALKLLNI